MKIADTHEFNVRVMDEVKNNFSIEESDSVLYDRMMQLFREEFNHLSMSEIIDTLQLMLYSTTHTCLEEQTRLENLKEKRFLK